MPPKDGGQDISSRLPLNDPVDRNCVESTLIDHDTTPIVSQTGFIGLVFNRSVTVAVTVAIQTFSCA